jgi:hypothetical protein
MLAVGAFMTAMSFLGLPQASPAEAGGWRTSAPPARYDAESIFRYIDGHGEVYRAYGMVACVAQRYSGPEGEGGIVVDVFEMSSAADAFGVFTHSREGEPAEVGQGGSFGYGSLVFWKGRHFVSVYAEQESPRARAAVMALGRAVASAVPETGDTPPLVGRLPEEGLDPRSVVYLRHPQILNAHVQLGPDNVLGLGPDAPAVVGRYRRGGASAELVIAAYPSEGAAEAAARGFAARVLAAGGPTGHEDGWYTCAPLPGSGHARAFVLRATSRETAEALLAEAGRKGGQR